MLNKDLLKEAEYTKNLTEDLKIVLNQDRIHVIVLRLETIVPVFFIKSLDSGGILHESNYDITVLGRCLLFDKNLITIKDTGVDHTRSIKLCSFGMNSAGTGK